MKAEEEKWKNLLNKTHVSKVDMNKLVLNFLALEGYKNAATKFAEETGLELSADEKYVLDDRKEIRELIQNDRIEEAITKINSLCPEVILILSIVIRD